MLLISLEPRGPQVVHETLRSGPQGGSKEKKSLIDHLSVLQSDHSHSPPKCSAVTIGRLVSCSLVLLMCHLWKTPYSTLSGSLWRSTWQDASPWTTREKNGSHSAADFHHLAERFPWATNWIVFLCGNGGGCMWSTTIPMFATVVHAQIHRQ